MILSWQDQFVYDFMKVYEFLRGSILSVCETRVMCRFLGSLGLNEDPVELV